jgi:uncharacterized protein (DUF2147 family)
MLHAARLTMIFPLLALPVLVGAATPGPGAGPEGYWRTASGHGIIEITHCGGEGSLCGKLAWFWIDPDDPNPQGLDLKNPNPAQRSRSLCGVTFMYAFKPTAPDHWEDGVVYDPESGNTYHATMTLRSDGRLDMHGYIGITLLGRSEIWSRYAGALPVCPGH